MGESNQALRRERELRGWSQRRVADEIDTNVDTVSKWERGINVPDPHFRAKLCELFGKTALELGFMTDLSPEPPGEKVAGVSYHPREDWGEAPFVGTLYGRDEELEKVAEWVLSDKCSLIALLGIGGIGKTSLVTKVAETVKSSFEYIFWRSLQNTPSLKSILRSCIQFFSQQKQIDLPESLNEQVLMFLDYLRKHRCLIILDNMESLLEGEHAGAYRPEYDDYATVLRYVGRANHQSCLLITSREQIREVAELEGQSNPVRAIQLSGLRTASGRELLQGTRMFGEEEAWNALIQLYAGNPLYLKLVSEPVREVFGGDIAKFLKKGRSMLGDIRDPLNLQFARLSTSEKSILYWLAVEREAVSLDELQYNYISPLAEEELPETLWSLRRRFLVEVDSAEVPHFSLQPVVLEYVTDRFIQDMTHDIKAEKIDGVCMSHSLIKAQAKDYIRDFQIRLILASVVKHLLREFEEQEIVKKLQRILTQCHSQYRQRSGYLAGNILNILTYLNSTLRGLDFSDLTVRQAYLRGAQLPDVNFTRANLAKSVFTDTFGSILTVALSYSGDLLAAGTANGEIRLWKVRDGTPLAHFIGHQGWVWSVAFNKDASLLVSGSEDETVRLWDVHSGKCLAGLYGHSNRVRSVAFSPDGKTIASGSEDKTIRLWSSSNGQCLKILEGYSRIVRPIAFSPDGATLLNGGASSSAWLWDVESGLCIRRFDGHVNQIWSVAFSNDGETIATAGDDQIIRLWDVESAICLRELRGHTNRIWSISFGANGNLLASGSDDKTIRLWDVKSGDCLKTLQGHTNRIWSVAARPDGKVVVSGSDDQTIRIWDAKTGQSLNTLQGHANWVWSVAWSPSNSNIVASCDEDLTIRLWDISTNQCFQILSGHTNRIRSLAFAPNGKTLVSSSEDQTARVWSLEGLCIQIFDTHSRTANRVWSATYSPSSEIIATGHEDQTIKIWDVKTGKCIRILTGHGGWVWAVAFSPDGTFLVSGGEDATVRIWDTTTGESRGILRGHASRIWAVAVSADTNFIASGGDDQSVLLWNRHTQQRIHSFEGHSNHVRSLSFSPDSSLLASASEDQTIRLWDLKTYEHLHTLQEHVNRIVSVDFSSDGRRIASGSHDGTIMIWDVETAQRLQTLRPDRPYERMDITDVKGITEAQKISLKLLGAIER